MIYALDDLSLIEEGITALDYAMDELQVTEEERPRKPVPLSPTTASSSVSAPSIVEFDPFKSIVVRNAIQPSREISATDRQLEVLQQRRVFLEGDRSTVVRETEVSS